MTGFKPIRVPGFAKRLLSIGLTTGLILGVSGCEVLQPQRVTRSDSIFLKPKPTSKPLTGGTLNPVSTNDHLNQALGEPTPGNAAAGNSLKIPDDK